MPDPEPSRPRFRATVHYDGTDFHGWQVQPGRRTVQGALEPPLQRLLGAPERIDAAGRTDTGVHAAGQEVAFLASERWEAGELRRALNALVPDDLWIEQLRPAPADFHPRFDATGRRYEYLVGTRPEAASPLRRERLWALGRTLDEDILVAATARVPGERRFDAFAKSGQPERGTRCRVESAGWWRTRTDDLTLRIVADRFLHRMVRYLVSTLLEVATGRRTLEELDALLGRRPDVRPPSPAPAHGLYLTGVRYAEGWNRPAGIPGVALTAPLGAAGPNDGAARGRSPQDAREGR